MATNWLIAPAIAFEIGGIAALFSPLSGWTQLAAYLVPHAIACVLFALVLTWLLPTRYRGQPLRAVLFLFTLQFAVPLLGILGVVMGILLALYLPRSEREVPWQETDIPELPFRPIDMGVQMVYSQGGLRQILREASDPDKRLKALIATRQMPDREAIGILREALKDKVDDVRLLAYSMLEQKEKALTQRAGRLQQALRTATEEESLSIQRRLAQVWWEMSYLGLAQGGLRTHFLDNAGNTLKRLIARRPQHNDWRLLGRIELEQGNLEAAEKAFKAAIERGAPKDLILPYLAETAFLQHNHSDVRRYLAECTRSPGNPAITTLAEAWL